MKDQDIRRVKLKEWIKQHYDGVQAKFIHEFGLNQGEVSALINGNRTFGERKARSLEEIANMPPKWLDIPPGNISTSARPIIAFDENDPLMDDEVIVPRLHLKLSAGTGKLMWHIDEEGSPNRFRRQWCVKKGVKPEHLVTLCVDGDSMSPTIPDRASVTIDTANLNIRNGKIHAVDYFGEFYIKRLFRMPDSSVLVQSDNQDKIKYPDWTITEENAEALRIMGSVICMQSDID